MRRWILFATTVAVALAIVPARAGSSDPSLATLVSECRAAVAAMPALPDPDVPIPSVGPLPPNRLFSQAAPRACRAMEAVIWSLAAACRSPFRSIPDPPESDPCRLLDGREINQARMEAYGRSWVHAALQLQLQLTGSAPLWEEQIPHTHNSSNSSAYSIPLNGSRPSYYATLTNQDPNHVYSIADQLNMDIRFVELDLHWVPSPYGNASTGFKWVTLCHGDSDNPAGVHVGCTYDRPLEDGLAEIRRWMDAHPDEFLFIYLENQLMGDTGAHEIAAKLIADAFAGAGAPGVVKPAATCASLPLGESIESLKATGSRILLVGNCDDSNGARTAWGSLVHVRGPFWDEGGDPKAYGEKECAADRQARATPSSFRRMWGDSTLLTATVDHGQDLTVAETEMMTRCGVNIIGFDQLTPDDGRLEALVWSWAPDEALEPGGDCAVQQGSDGEHPGRFAGRKCNKKRVFACVDPGLSWHVTSAKGKWEDGFAACAAEFPGSAFGVPLNAYRNQLLIEANATGADVWLNYRRVDGAWQANLLSP